MPIYEYQCGNCNSKIERLQKIADLPLIDCPECAAPKLRKLVSAGGFILKGTGWYATDFKNKGKSKDELAASKAPAESGATTAASTTSTSTVTESATTSTASTATAAATKAGNSSTAATT